VNEVAVTAPLDTLKDWITPES